MSQTPSPNTPHFQTYARGGLDHGGFDAFHQNFTKVRRQIPRSDVGPSPALAVVSGWAAPLPELCWLPCHPGIPAKAQHSHSTFPKHICVHSAETRTHPCDIPGAKLWIHGYRTRCGAKGSSQQHCTCAILSWARFCTQKLLNSAKKKELKNVPQDS